MHRELLSCDTNNGRMKANLTKRHGICSTLEDLRKEYNTVTAHPEVLGLSKDSSKW